MKKFLIYLVKLYQKYLSPDHSFWAKKMNNPPYCKHIPSCSDYMIESIKKKGVLVGVPKGIFRIMRCIPFTKGGYDPVEKRKRKQNYRNSKLTNFLLKYQNIVLFICTLIFILLFVIIFAKDIANVLYGPKINIEFQNKLQNDFINIENTKRQNLILKIKYLDLINDNSLTKFVNNKVPFNKPGYIPNDLESISTEYIYDIKGNSKLRREVNLAIQNLAEDFYQEFSKKLSIVSAYRSYNYQVGIKSGGCPDNLCAKAGYSEHQTGLAVDIFSTSTQYEWQTNSSYIKYYNWFKDNAHKYGFHNTYQKGLKTDGYEIEPWHWRYLGIDLATYLKDKGITLAEFYEEK